MANAKISQLPAVTSAGGSDLAVAVATGTTSQITVDNLFKDRTLDNPTLTSAQLGTPDSGTLTNCTGLPIATGVSGLGTNVATALAVNIGSAGAPVVLNGALGTPSSGTLTSCTGLPVSTGVSGLGTNVATALAVNVGSAGAFVVLGGALGTPASGTLTNATGLPIGTGVSGLGTGVATALAVNVGTTGSAQLFITASTANLTDISNAINTTGKFAGKQVWDSTANVPLWAAGATAGDVWIDGTGATVVTPV